MSSAMEQLYQQIILDHAKARHGNGLLAAAGSAVGESHQLNPVCGDEITLRLTLRDRQAATRDPEVATLSWEGDGCAISMASASVLSTIAPGLTQQQLVDVVDNFRQVLRSRGTIEASEDILGDAAAFSGVSRYPARVKCAMLAWVAAEEALLAAQPGR